MCPQVSALLYVQYHADMCNSEGEIEHIDLEFNALWSVELT